MSRLNYRFFIMAAMLFCLYLPHTAQAKDEKPLPRTVYAVYDSEIEPDPKYTKVHQYLEVVLNHLGIVVKFVDVSQPLPKMTDDVRGIVVWTDYNTEINNPDGYLDWLEEAVEQDKKLIVLGGVGVSPAYYGKPNGFQRINKLLRKIGVEELSIWESLTYHAHIVHQDDNMVGFERDFGGMLPPYFQTRAYGPGSVSYLTVQQGEDPDSMSDQVIISPRGGYVSSGYMIYTNQRLNSQQWYLNPFLFMRTALDLPGRPKPDVTTLNGRRIFYSHIDGDGWSSVTEIEKYLRPSTPAAKVLLEEIFRPYQDFPFTMGFIVGDLDPECHGVAGGIEIAKTMLALPNVQAGSHSYTHPLFWRFFQHLTPEKETPFLDHYPRRPNDPSNVLSRSWTKVLSLLEKNDLAGDREPLPPPQPKMNKRLSRAEQVAHIKDKLIEKQDEEMLKSYDTPRSYACGQFDLRREVEGSIEFIESFSPPEKKVEIYQWSGNTSPYEEAIAQVRKAGLLNINGGDSRFDTEYPSYTWVSPIGLKIGNEQQIYSSNSNENTYTFLWSKRFYGYRYLRNTIENTESPYRIKPFNIYFHVYSAQKAASLSAVKENLEYARSLEIIPITAKQYTGMANDFYKVEIIPVGDMRWKIRQRGQLQTMRFDQASRKAVDFAGSKGVLGQRYHQGSLYVALDPAVEEPIIQLMVYDNFGNYPIAKQPYLLSSRWQISDYDYTKQKLTFTAKGYGLGEMLWKMPADQEFTIEVKKGQNSLYKSQETATNNGFLRLKINTLAIDGVAVTIVPEKAGKKK